MPALLLLVLVLLLNRPSCMPAGGVEGEVENSFLLSKPQNCNLREAHISIEAEQGRFLLTSDQPAFYLFPECDLPGHFSDAAFTLLPGEPREISFLPHEGDSATGLSAENIRIKHLRASYD